MLTCTQCLYRLLFFFSRKIKTYANLQLIFFLLFHIPISEYHACLSQPSQVNISTAVPFAFSLLTSWFGASLSQPSSSSLLKCLLKWLLSSNLLTTPHIPSIALADNFIEYRLVHILLFINLRRMLMAHRITSTLSNLAFKTLTMRLQHTCQLLFF